MYSAHYETRRVTKIGVVTWKSKRIFTSTALGNQTIGFEHIEDGLWSVFFGDVLLGRLFEAESRIIVGAGR